MDSAGQPGGGGEYPGGQSTGGPGQQSPGSGAPGGPPGWQAPPSGPPSWQQAGPGGAPRPGMSFGTPTGIAGPVAGTQIADFTTRLIAYIIDGVIIGIANQILQAILFNTIFISLGFVGLLIYAIVVAILDAGYFIYLWTNRGSTLGMQVLKLQVVDATGGGFLPQNRAITRWVYLELPRVLFIVLYPFIGLGFGFGLAFALGGLAILFLLLALFSLGWEIYLAYTTSQDARKQGIHDKAANSVVVRLPA